MARLENRNKKKQPLGVRKAQAKQRLGDRKSPKTKGKAPKASDIKGADRVAARMAAQAYEPPDKRQDIDDWQYSRADSGLRLGVYKRTDPKTSEPEVYLAFRGTDFKNPRDLYTDTQILIGKQRKTTHFKEGLESYDRIKKKYPDAQISASGHSLGAALTTFVNKKRTLRKASAFNTGTGKDIQGFTDKMRCKLPKSVRPKFCSKLTTHLVKGDPLSTAANVGSYGQIVNYQSHGLTGSHTIDNFTNSK